MGAGAAGVAFVGAGRGDPEHAPAIESSDEQTADAHRRDSRTIRLSVQPASAIGGSPWQRCGRMLG